MSVFISRKILSLSAVALSLAVAGCVSYPSASSTPVAMKATQGNTASGDIHLSPAPGGVRLQGQISGLKAGAEHGFHVHEKGDCSAPDATSAGGHFNPEGHAHGLVAGAVHHAGDLPALKADAQGMAKFDAVVAGLTLSAGSHSVTGRSLVIHRDPDDGVTQPTGNSGPRVACGVIAAAPAAAAPAKAAY